jgi:hypothetical protein
MPNRHRIDQLADVRAEIKALKQREELLRSEVVASGEMIGDENEATLSEFTVERVDLELMKKELGLIFLRSFLREQPVTQLRIKPRQTKTTRRTTT